MYNLESAAAGYELALFYMQMIHTDWNLRFPEEALTNIVCSMNYLYFTTLLGRNVCDHHEKFNF